MYIYIYIISILVSALSTEVPQLNATPPRHNLTLRTFGLLYLNSGHDIWSRNIRNVSHVSTRDP